MNSSLDTTNITIEIDGIATLIYFREILPHDLIDIKQLHEDIFPIRYSDEYYEATIHKQGLFDLPLATIVAISSITNKIIGFIFYQFLDTNECEDKNLFLSNPSQVCYVLVFGLQERYRRSGLGTILMNLCIEDAIRNKQCGCIYVHVIHYNHPALNFYKKCNFLFLRRISGKII